MYISDLSHSNLSLAEKLQRLYHLSRGCKIDLRFRPPFLNLLKAFGDPHKNLPPIIHVAGTNGKGSTLAFLRAFLEEQGKCVHVMTSPHLVHFNERIVLAGKDIEDGPLEDLIDEAIALNNGADITFFEITTVLAFAAFSRVKADYLLLETGMGGRLDCTNIIEDPILTIITSISRDHEQFLGDTLAKIAGEKAGIIKPHVSCIIAKQDSKEALDVLEHTAHERKAPLMRADQEWFMKAQNGHCYYRSDKNAMTLPLPNLKGAHQIDNAGTALAALEVVGESFEQERLSCAIKKVYWPARLQKMQTEQEGWEIWLDGGHNESAGQALAQQGLAWKEEDNKPLYLIIGMMSLKTPDAFFAAVTPLADHVYTVPIEGEPLTFAPDKLCALVKESSCTCADSLDSALSALFEHQEPGRILITGSLYLAGEYLKKKTHK